MSTLEQDFTRHYGVIQKLAELSFENALQRKLVPGSETERLIDTLTVLAIRAAAADPAAFHTFARLYTQGPDATWVVESTLAEPLGRGEVDVLVTDWRTLLDVRQPASAVRTFSQLAMMATLLEFRVRPFLLAQAHLLDMAAEAQRGGGSATKGEIKLAIWKRFFEHQKEVFDTTLPAVLVPSVRGMRAAMKDLKEAIENAKAGAILDPDRIATLEAMRESLRNDTIPPDQRAPGTTARIGVVELRNQLQHGNVSLRKDGSVFLGYAKVYEDHLHGRNPGVVPQFSAVSLDRELARFEEIGAVIFAWEFVLRNFDYWLSEWGVV